MTALGNSFNSLDCLLVVKLICFAVIAIAIKESAKIGDKTQRRAAKGIDDLGKYTLCSSCLLAFHQASLEAYIVLIVVAVFQTEFVYTFSSSFLIFCLKVY